MNSNEGRDKKNERKYIYADVEVTTEFLCVTFELCTYPPQSAV